MKAILLGFFLHEDTLHLYLEDENGKEREMRFPKEQDDYDPFVLYFWSKNQVPLVFIDTYEHAILIETLLDGTEYPIKFVR